MKYLLIIGLGSIAKKHLTVLKKLEKKIKIFKLTSKNKKKSINYINDLILKYNLKLALVCSPTSSHLDYINYLKKKKLII